MMYYIENYRKYFIFYYQTNQLFAISQHCSKHWGEHNGEIKKKKKNRWNEEHYLNSVERWKVEKHRCRLRSAKTKHIFYLLRSRCKSSYYD